MPKKVERVGGEGGEVLVKPMLLGPGFCFSRACSQGQTRQNATVLAKCAEGCGKTQNTKRGSKEPASFLEAGSNKPGKKQLTTSADALSL